MQLLSDEQIASTMPADEFDAALDSIDKAAPDNIGPIRIDATSYADAHAEEDGERWDGLS